MTISNRVRTSQPQFIVELDQNNPLCKGLSFVSYGNNPVDIVTGRIGTKVGTVTPVVGIKGRGLQTATGAANRIDFTHELDSGGSAYSFGSVFIQTYPGAIQYLIMRELAGINSGVNTIIMMVQSASGSPTIQISFGTTGFLEGLSIVPNTTWSVASVSTPPDGSLLATEASIWLNGIKSGNRVVTNSSVVNRSTQTNLHLNGRPSDNARQLNGAQALSVEWRRRLTDAEHRSFNDNPWQIFKPIATPIFADAFSNPPSAFGAWASISIANALATASTSGGGAGNASGAPYFVTIASALSTSTGKASSSAAPAALTIANALAAGAGKAAATATPTQLTLNSANAVASGKAAATAAVSGSVTLGNLLATSTGKATGSNAPASLSIGNTAASGSGKATASGILGVCSIAVANATANAKATASVIPAQVSIAGAQASAYASGGATGNAFGNPAAISVATGSASGNGKASTSTAPSYILVQPATASAGGSASAFAAFMSAVLSPTAATASGKALGVATPDAVSITSATASAYITGIVWPDPSSVLSGTTYGPTGVEFTGTMAVPTAAAISSAIQTFALLNPMASNVKRVNNTLISGTGASGNPITAAGAGSHVPPTLVTEADVIADFILTAADTTPIAANLEKVNDTVLAGTGVLGDSMRPA